ncbi:MAG: hypothetical protein V4480_03460 [Patescibacteria group bacterium]
MTIPGSRISIRRAGNPEDLSCGLAFLTDQYRKAFDVSPSPPDHLLVAWQDGVVVGTIGVNVRKAEGGLRLARLYRFERASAPLPVEFDRTAEIAKWAAETGGISCALLSAAIRFSILLGKEHGWCEHNPGVGRIFRRFGVMLFPVPGAKRDDALVETYHRPYYERNQVGLSMFSLRDAREVLDEYLRTHGIDADYSFA